MMNTATNKK